MHMCLVKKMTIKLISSVKSILIFNYSNLFEYYFKSKSILLILIKIYFGGCLVLSNSEASTNREHTSLYTFSLNFLKYTQIGQRAPYHFVETQLPESADYFFFLLQIS